MSRVRVFAFGSNLDWHQMRRRCPSAKPMTQAIFHDARLAFTGYSRGWGGGVATLVDAPGRVTIGMVYTITQEDLVVLDACEGHPRHYVRERCEVVAPGGRPFTAWSYFLERDYSVPSPRYVAAIRRGYDHWGFNRRLLRNAVRFTRRRYQADFERRFFAEDGAMVWEEDDANGGRGSLHVAS